MSADEYYWLNHRRHISNGRMAWYAENPDEEFWHSYFEGGLNKEYYLTAMRTDLHNDELGRILIQEMNPSGVHLEAGCGAGKWVACLRNYGLNVEGIEYSKNLVEVVQQIYPELPVRYGNALSIDCAEGHYDTYLSFGVVEHRIEGPGPFLSEAYRVLKENGKIIISVPFFGPLRRLKAFLRYYEPSKPDLPFFQYGFTKSDFVHYVEQAGFEVMSIHPLYPNRLLKEEWAFHRWLGSLRGYKYWKRLAMLLLANRDGHMLLIVGQKSG